MHNYSRRQALVHLAGIAGALALTGSTPLASSAQSLLGNNADDDERDELPPPATSGIEHIVVVMMENRSFDHFLGWLPGADGRQAGLRYADKTGALHPTHRLAPDFQGCGFADPDHSFEGGRIEYNNGRCDGWLRAGANDLYSIGYYTRPDLAFFGQVAPKFAAPDRYFAAFLGPTFPNRIFQHAGQTDRLSNTLPTEDGERRAARRPHPVWRQGRGRATFPTEVPASRKAPERGLNMNSQAGKSGIIRPRAVFLLPLWNGETTTTPNPATSTSRGQVGPRWGLSSHPGQCSSICVPWATMTTIAA